MEKRIRDMVCDCESGGRYRNLFNLVNCKCRIEVEEGKWEDTYFEHIGAEAKEVWTERGRIK